MSNEYLWQRTGDDPEIARLEKALAVFRYREGAPPAIPVATAERGPWRLRFAIAFATPAFAAIAIAAGLWFQSEDSEITFVHQPPTESVERPIEIRTPIVQPVPQPKQPVDRRSYRAQSATLRIPRKVRVQKSAIADLTDEERYAYQQLMLALSISSSKLRVVQDAINGVEENETSLKQNDR